MTARPEIVVSTQDYRRLNQILDNLPESAAVEMLMAELDRAQVVDPEELPADVVSMHSTVKFAVLSTGKEFTYTLVYPSEADGLKKKLSILTPVGSALIGLSVGQEIEWPLPDGKVTRVRIEEIIPQSDEE